MKNNNFTADIIYPQGCNDASPQSVALCEGFIVRLILSSQEQLKIQINTSSMLIECNDIEIKNYLDLLLKSRRINDFYIQFKEFLHYDEQDAQKRLLLCRINNKKIVFCVDELIGLPDFNWKIYKINK